MMNDFETPLANAGGVPPSHVVSGQFAAAQVYETFEAKIFSHDVKLVEQAVR